LGAEALGEQAEICRAMATPGHRRRADEAVDARDP
jgi:hypothetical protein